MENKEIWKDVVWYEGRYKVSNKGRVKRLKFFKNSGLKETVLKKRFGKRWYIRYALYKQSKQKNFSIHRLVAIAFLDNPESKPQVNHINGIKDDNRLENLEWCTQSENMRHAFDTWLKKPSHKGKFWKNNHQSKPINQYSKDEYLIKKWDSIMDVQRELWINNSNISQCCKWKQKSAGWFIWKYC